MPNQPSPKKSQAPSPAVAKLKRLPVAFPFRRKGRGQFDASAQFTDEHEIYRLLAEREPSGAYLISRTGKWHGGLHVTEAGAGQALDLDAGLRCIADGELVAFRANRTYPISEIRLAGSESPAQVPYSTGFALVQHTMEFPPGTELTFYSLYMHLMSWDDYANFPQREKPSYWPRQWTVTRHAQDKPLPDRNGRAAEPSQQGLRVRKAVNGTPIGIVPQGASVSIGKREGAWGQVTSLHGASLYPARAGGYADPLLAIGGWVRLGEENGGPVVEEIFPDSMFDRVIVTAGEACGTTGLNQQQGASGSIRIEAGQFIGHLGRYDSLHEGTSGTRMAHIEVFCGDGIESFLEHGRAWVDQHGPRKEDWAALGLPSDPSILRIESGTELYQRTQDNKFIAGADAYMRKTAVVQVYSLAELARGPSQPVVEPHPKLDPGYPATWWFVQSVNHLGHPIEGWVCDFNFPGGRVTREYAQQWVDFECLAGRHDPAHTVFATTQAWIDYVCSADVADPASRAKLSPLMLLVYDALFKTGDRKQAAGELCSISKAARDGYPWLMKAASRLIVKHESEWANPSKWRQLIVELEKATGEKPQHELELKRIETLTWWNEMKGCAPGFPRPEVFHINAIALVANFLTAGPRITVAMLRKIWASSTVPDIRLAELADELNSNLSVYKLDTEKRLSHFFAQVGEEVGPHFKMVEVLDYSPENLRATFKYFRDRPLEADIYGRTLTHPANQQEIANRAYNGESGNSHLGNGSIESGDGWRYRGRGLKQTTGRYNYASFNSAYSSLWPEDGVDFIENPDLLGEIRYGVRAAVYFWLSSGLYRIADQTDADSAGDAVDSITEIINKGTSSYGERRRRYQEIVGNEVFAEIGE